MIRTGWILLFVLLGANLAHAWWIFPQLPDPVASHFGAGNLADNWMAKSSYMVIGLLPTLGMMALFATLALTLPKIPVRWLNMPNKHYWTEPERAPATYRSLAGWMLFYGILTGVFMLGMAQCVFEANLADPQQLPGWFLPLLFGYLAVMIGSVGLIYWRFRKPATK